MREIERYIDGWREPAREPTNRNGAQLCRGVAERRGEESAVTIIHYLSCFTNAAPRDIQFIVARRSVVSL